MNLATAAVTDTIHPTRTTVTESHLFQGTTTEPDVFLYFIVTSEAGDFEILGEAFSSSTQNGSGTYDYEFPTSILLPEGYVDVQISQTDLANNTGPDKEVYLHVVPVGAGLTITPSLRDGASPVITGTGIPGATIELKGDDDLNGGTSEVVLGTATVDDEENWVIISK